MSNKNLEKEIQPFYTLNNNFIKKTKMEIISEKKQQLIEKNLLKK